MISRSWALAANSRPLYSLPSCLPPFAGWAPGFRSAKSYLFRSALGAFVVIAAALASGGPSLLFTANIGSHALRSTAGTIAMFCNFAAYTLLPLADATAIGFAAPLFVVVISD